MKAPDIVSRAILLGRPLAPGTVLGGQRAARAAHLVATTRPAGDAHLASDRKELLSFLPTLIEDLQSYCEVDQLPKGWLGKLLDYVVPRGNLYRGCSAVNACRELLPPDRAALGKPLGLALELIMEGPTVIITDLSNSTAARRRMVPDHGAEALNDGVAVNCASHLTLRHYFHTEPCYPRLLELFNETALRSSLAANYEFDYDYDSDATARFDALSHKTHRAQTRFKISEYMFYNPLAAVLHLAGAADPARLDELWRIVSDIGQLYTVQDEYLDCYEDDKAQSNIRSGRCTWLAVEAKVRGDEKQCAILRKNYGFDDAEKVAAVVDLFADLGLEKETRDWIRAEYVRIGKEIDRQSLLPPSILHYALDGIRHSRS